MTSGDKEFNPLWLLGGLAIALLLAVYLLGRYGDPEDRRSLRLGGAEANDPATSEGKTGARDQ
jgi:hypothetical protein